MKFDVIAFFIVIIQFGLKTRF